MSSWCHFLSREWDRYLCEKDVTEIIPDPCHSDFRYYYYRTHTTYDSKYRTVPIVLTADSQSVQSKDGKKNANMSMNIYDWISLMVIQWRTIVRLVASTLGIVSCAVFDNQKAIEIEIHRRGITVQYWSNRNRRKIYPPHHAQTRTVTNFRHASRTSDITIQNTRNNDLEPNCVHYKVSPFPSPSPRSNTSVFIIPISLNEKASSISYGVENTQGSSSPRGRSLLRLYDIWKTSRN